MDPKCPIVLDAALALSEDDRAIIAQTLLETLSPEDAELVDDELAAELDVRLEEFRNAPSTTVRWSELRDEG
jgi:putative addiction module component (TIGR02574 family)